MALDINQFTQSAQKGQMTFGVNLNVLTARVYASTVATTLIPGCAVKLVDVAGNTPIIDKAAATDPIFGFIVFDPKKASAAVAGDVVEIAFDNSFMFMEAGAAIAQGAAVEIVAATNKVITSAGINKIVGIAMRKATADTNIIPVMIKTPLINQVISNADVANVSFLALSDTPDAYVASNFVKVNGGATALVFAAS